MRYLLQRHQKSNLKGVESTQELRASSDAISITKLSICMCDSVSLAALYYYGHVLPVVILMSCSFHQNMGQSFFLSNSSYPRQHCQPGSSGSVLFRSLGYNNVMTFSIRMQLTPFADSLDMQVHTDTITFHSMYYIRSISCKCFSCSRGSFPQPILLDSVSCFSPSALSLSLHQLPID